MAIDKSLFELDLQYQTQKVKLNPVVDSAYLRSAEEEKQNISACIAYYGGVFAYQKKLLSIRKRERSEIYQKCREIVESTLSAKGSKTTESAIQAGVEAQPAYREKSIEIEDAEFNVNFLEQAMWALKTKADNIRESIKSDKFTQ